MAAVFREVQDFIMEDELPNQIAMAMAFENGNMNANGVPVMPDPATVATWKEETDYSEKYCDDVYEYRRVTVPRAMLQVLPVGRCMTENEWRANGITMSRGWEHYDHHSPEANVLLFRRIIGTHPKTGEVPEEIRQKVLERQRYIADLEELRRKMMAAQMDRRGNGFLPAPDQIGGA